MNAVSLSQSRWGFHPCDYSLFLKLKRLHRWYWQTVYDFHRWHRWWRKQPQNRRGPEPSYCGLFVVDKGWLKPVLVHGEPGFAVYPKTVVDHDLVILYQTARRPRADAEAVRPFDAATVARIEALYEQAQAFFQE
jgi:hypothetical protein